MFCTSCRRFAAPGPSALQNDNLVANSAREAWLAGRPSVIQRAPVVRARSRRSGRLHEASCENYVSETVSTPDLRSRVVADACPMRCELSDARALTPGQARFAREHNALPGMHATHDERMVFLYRDNRCATYRWLLDESGEAVDTAKFRRCVPRVSVLAVTGAVAPRNSRVRPAQAPRPVAHTQRSGWLSALACSQRSPQPPLVAAARLGWRSRGCL